ncbi:MAG: hypothetical protein HY563_05320 [Ignavibacteriales bacterium]|nr:hypothetical protein [Ignavibacteriales bacterium]
MVRTKKSRDAEYRLRAFPVTDAESGHTSLALVVETIKEFVSFHYEVLLSDTREKNQVTLHILGLHAPSSVMPGVGPARGIRRYDNLSGPVRVIVRKVDGEENMFKLRVRLPAVQLLAAPPHPFVMFSTEPIELPE